MGPGLLRVPTGNVQSPGIVRWTVTPADCQMIAFFGRDDEVKRPSGPDGQGLFRIKSGLRPMTARARVGLDRPERVRSGKPHDAADSLEPLRRGPGAHLVRTLQRGRCADPTGRATGRWRSWRVVRTRTGGAASSHHQAGADGEGCELRGDDPGQFDSDLQTQFRTSCQTLLDVNGRHKGYRARPTR